MTCRRRRHMKIAWADRIHHACGKGFPTLLSWICLLLGILQASCLLADIEYHRIASIMACCPVPNPRVKMGEHSR